MKYKTVEIFLMSILLFSCSGKKNRAFKDSEPSHIEASDSNKKNEVHKEIPASITGIGREFELTDPDIKLISSRAQFSGNSRLYTYIKSSYIQELIESPGGAKGAETPCAFSQTFSPGITYFQTECSNGSSRYELTTPNIGISKLKALFAILFDSGDIYHWSKDSLSHKTSEDGINGAGGSYRYEQSGDKIKSIITYTD